MMTFDGERAFFESFVDALRELSHGLSKNQRNGCKMNFKLAGLNSRNEVWIVKLVRTNVNRRAKKLFDLNDIKIQ